MVLNEAQYHKNNNEFFSYFEQQMKEISHPIMKIEFNLRRNDWGNARHSKKNLLFDGFESLASCSKVKL